MKNLAVFVFSFASIASAGTLSSSLTVDNAFDLYISTSDAILGTLVGSGNDWTTTYGYSTGLANGTNYIHVVAINQGGQGGFIGDFSLNDAAFQFVDGTQHLLTSVTDNWGFNTTGFGNPYVTPLDEGANGVGPWGTRPGISGSARWLWDPN